MIQSILAQVTGLKKIVPVVRMSGIIRTNGSPTSDISAKAFRPVLDGAFTQRNVAAVALVINSPGGSPVQSSLIYQQVLYLKQRHRVPVHAFVEDAAASGGYFIACAADTIVCDESSILGSVGVVSQSFGVTQAMERLGIEARVHTAGASKSQLSPFHEEKPADKLRLAQMLQALHENFIKAVKEGRGNRLKPELALQWTQAVEAEVARLSGATTTAATPAPPSAAAGAATDGQGLLDGSFYDGRRSVQLGLADEIGNLQEYIQKRYGHDVVFREVKPRADWGRVLGMSMGMSGTAEAIVEAATNEARAEALWSRIGGRV